MKKTIKILAEKMIKIQQRSDGTLQGGFASIKGGFVNTFFSTNSTPVGCTNSHDCTHSTNTFSCSNTGTCFI